MRFSLRPLLCLFGHDIVWAKFHQFCRFEGNRLREYVALWCPRCRRYIGEEPILTTEEMLARGRAR